MPFPRRSLLRTGPLGLACAALAATTLGAGSARAAATAGPPPDRALPGLPPGGPVSSCPLCAAGLDCPQHVT